MAIHIILFLTTVALLFYSQNKNLHPKYFLFLSFLGMTLVLGLRGSTVGEDTAMFLRVAEASVNIPWLQMLSEFPQSVWSHTPWIPGLTGWDNRIETFYLVYNKIIMLIFRDAQWVLITSALITSVLVAKFIKENVKERKDIYFATFVYLTGSIYMTSFNLMRQMLAMSIALQAVKHIRDGKIMKPVFYIILATLLHQSAILCLVFIPLYRLKNKKKWLKYVVISAIFIATSLQVLANVIGTIWPRYRLYLTISYWETTFGWGMFLFWILILLACIYMCWKGIESEDDYVLIYMMILYLAVEAVGLRYTILARVAIYFRVFLVLFYPISFMYFKGNTRTIYKLVVIAMMTGLYFLYASSPARAFVPFWHN